MTSPINTLELKSILQKKNITQEKLASMLNISIASCNKKINGTTMWKVPEIMKTTEILELTKEMMLLIFFNWV